MEARSVWFLIILFSAFIFMEILKFMESKMKCKYTSWIYVAGWILLCIVLPDSIFRLYKLKFFFPYFVLGYFIHKHTELFPLEKYKKLLGINASVFIIAIYLVRKNDLLNLFYQLSIKELSILQIMTAIILSFLGIAFIFFAAFLLSKTKPGYIIRVWGIYSLDIYVIHMFFVTVLFEIVRRLNISGNMIDYIASPMAAIAVILIIAFSAKKIKLKAYDFITGK